MGDRSQAELCAIRRFRRDLPNEENRSKQQLQEQMALFQQQRDLFLRIQRQARETSAAERRRTALTEGPVRKKSEPYGRWRSKEVGETDISHSMSDCRAVQSTNAQERRISLEVIICQMIE